MTPQLARSVHKNVFYTGDVGSGTRCIHLRRNNFFEHMERKGLWKTFNY